MAAPTQIWCGNFRAFRTTRFVNLFSHRFSLQAQKDLIAIRSAIVAQIAPTIFKPMVELFRSEVRSKIFTVNFTAWIVCQTEPDVLKRHGILQDKDVPSRQANVEKDVLHLLWSFHLYSYSHRPSYRTENLVMLFARLLDPTLSHTVRARFWMDSNSGIGNFGATSPGSKAQMVSFKTFKS